MKNQAISWSMSIPSEFDDLVKELISAHIESRSLHYVLLESELKKRLCINEDRKQIVINQILSSAKKAKRTRLTKKDKEYYEQELFTD